jgi:uracil phosphoribosyltransferase
MVSLPESIAGRSAYVLDPMLATGGSAAYTARLLAERGASQITIVCVIASPEGLRFIQDSQLPVARIVTANVDERLNDVGFIVPGLGDAGDRQFGEV